MVFDASRVTRRKTQHSGCVSSFFHIRYLKLGFILKGRLGYYAKLSTMHVFSLDLRLFSPLELLKRMQLGIVDHSQRKRAFYGWYTCFFVIVSGVESQQKRLSCTGYAEIRKRDSDKGLCNSTKLLVELGRTEWECHMVSLGMTVQNRVPKREI